eukprot:TRINITY_DN43923_c0_g1_i1.p1 TRINITY_DN43923_c0_g1~~TRINITY_DN43923_c0_g1_i1.p1  ORF type:complete len:141 (-),score=14.38 TRINITY_DN43923_c0_g1_i1:18-404(-)
MDIKIGLGGSALSCFLLDYLASQAHIRGNDRAILLHRLLIEHRVILEFSHLPGGFVRRTVGTHRGSGYRLTGTQYRKSDLVRQQISLNMLIGGIFHCADHHDGLSAISALELTGTQSTWEIQSGTDYC